MKVAKKQETLKQNRKNLMKVKAWLNCWSVFKGILQEVLVQILLKEYSLVQMKRGISFDMSESLYRTSVVLLWA